MQVLLSKAGRISNRFCLGSFIVLLAACQQDGTELLPVTGREYSRAELQQVFAVVNGLGSDEFAVPTRETVTRRYQTALAQRSGPAPDFRSVLVGDDILPAISIVMREIPDFGALTDRDIAIISRDFGGMSRADVIRNLDAIRELYPAKIRRDMYMELQHPNAATYDKAALSPRMASTPNASERWLLAANPQYAIGTIAATVDAYAIAGTYGANKDGTRWNGLRHALWNVLIAKYTGDWHRTIDGANGWAKAFTDAHEWGSPLPDPILHTYMDLHNNQQGRNYFASVAWIHKKAYVLPQVKAPDVATILQALKLRTQNAKKFSRVPELTNYPNSMVYFLDS